MLVRAFPKLILCIGPLLVLGYVFFIYFDGAELVQPAINWSKSFNFQAEKGPPETQDPLLPLEEALPTTTANSQGLAGDASTEAPTPAETSTAPQEPLPSLLFSTDDAGEVIVNYSAYREVFSVSTADRKYFAVDFGPSFPAMNPNIIPHPHKQDTWIIAAQLVKGLTPDAVFEELVCDAVFREDDSLGCINPPTVLPITPTHGGHCKGKLAHFSISVGPHDMRVFYGPTAPFSVFGSQSAHTCFGLFVQDFRGLLNEFPLETLDSSPFKVAAELQRPPPWGAVEKNWFLFWDAQGQVYVHHDMEPKRVFAQLMPYGSVGPDLAPLAAANDDACMAKYMPKPAPENENLHQATNSLSITLCKHNDVSCHPSVENTFIMTVFQHKRYRNFHSMYEPYVMLFQQNAPFAIHGISQKPVWIHGRGVLTKDSGILWQSEGAQVPEDHSEMFYVTSMSWKAQSQRYHGYIDDVLFLGFGIEDSRTGAIDILAGDLLQDLGLCIDTGVGNQLS